MIHEIESSKEKDDAPCEAAALSNDGSLNVSLTPKGKWTRREVMQAGAASGIAGVVTSLGFGAPFVLTSRKAEAARPVVGLINDPRFSAPVIDPRAIPKFAQALPTPGTDWPVVDLSLGGPHTLYVAQRNAQILPPVIPGGVSGPTPVWAYRNDPTNANAIPPDTADVTYLGPTLVAAKGMQVDITYDYSPLFTAANGLREHIVRRGLIPTQSVVDLHVHGTDMGEPQVRFIAHLHGGAEVAPNSDGYSEAWVTPDGTQNLPTATGTIPDSGLVPGAHLHHYPNAHGASLVWYHDHALGITRLNVYAGLAGGYLITDANEQGLIGAGSLPALGGAFDVPLVIQDRMFYPGGRLAYPDMPALPVAGCPLLWPFADVSTMPEYFGDVMVVNGKAWPSFTVDPAIYRLRFLNGCNSRFLVLDLSAAGGAKVGPTFTIIGTEGGLLPGAVLQNSLLMGPAERMDVLVDFRAFAGQSFTLTNRGAKKPFPGGAPTNVQTDGMVMQFVVRAAQTQVPQITVALPQILNSTPTPLSLLTPTTPRRGVLLYEGLDAFGRIQPLLGSVSPPVLGVVTATPKLWADPVTETVTSGAVEIWEIYNTTADSHPIHLHEILFSVVDRQAITVNKKLVAGVCGVAIPPFPIALKGAAIPALPYETGFKDTVVTYPGEVTRVIADFRHAVPGRYAWHCHILEHEDHEMMRPYDIV